MATTLPTTLITKEQEQKFATWAQEGRDRGLEIQRATKAGAKSSVRARQGQRRGRGLERGQGKPEGRYPQ